jgi:hypothetical protein
MFLDKTLINLTRQRWLLHTLASSFCIEKINSYFKKALTKLSVNFYGIFVRIRCHLDSMVKKIPSQYLSPVKIGWRVEILRACPTVNFFKGQGFLRFGFSYISNSKIIKEN